MAHFRRCGLSRWLDESPCRRRRRDLCDGIPDRGSPDCPIPSPTSIAVDSHGTASSPQQNPYSSCHADCREALPRALTRARDKSPDRGSPAGHPITSPTSIPVHPHGRPGSPRQTPGLGCHAPAHGGPIPGPALTARPPRPPGKVGRLGPAVCVRGWSNRPSAGGCVWKALHESWARLFNLVHGTSARPKRHPARPRQRLRDAPATLEARAGGARAPRRPRPTCHVRHNVGRGGRTSTSSRASPTWRTSAPAAASSWMPSTPAPSSIGAGSAPKPSASSRPTTRPACRS